jgi:hypothetical protein
VSRAAAGAGRDLFVSLRIFANVGYPRNCTFHALAELLHVIRLRTDPERDDADWHGVQR